MLPMVSKESGKAHFNAIVSQTMKVEQGAVTLVDCALTADFRGTVALGVNGVQGMAGVVT